MLHKLAKKLVYGNKANPLLVLLDVIFGYSLFNIAEAGVEHLIWGERFYYVFDYVFISAVLVFYLYCVYLCWWFRWRNKSNAIR